MENKHSDSRTIGQSREKKRSLNPDGRVENEGARWQKNKKRVIPNQNCDEA